MRFPFLLSLILLQLLALIAIGIQSIACEPWRHTVCSAPNTTEFGYVTLLSSDEFLPGAIVLVESLKQTGTNNDIVVMILPHISLSSRTKLCLVGIIVVEIDYIDNPYAEAMVAKRQRYNFSKLRIWQFSHYRRLVFLGNCDLLYMMLFGINIA
jgi:alpha-N-acetylglucosamine transferase